MYYFADLLLKLPENRLGIKKKHLVGVPKYAGVYFLFCDNELVYVGQAEHIRNRVICHHIWSLLGELEIAWLLVDSALLRLAIEARYIEEQKPRLNGILHSKR